MQKLVKDLLSLYRYDATGRRVAKRVQVSGLNSSDLWTFYTYDGWRVLEERELTGSPRLKRQFVYGDYLDEPLTMDVADSGKRYLYLQNTLFSVTGLVDASNGALVEAYAYDPYGRHWRITNAGGSPISNFSASTLAFALGAESSLGNPYLFTGQRFDPETGLHSYKYRYYDCGLGRFVSRDPIGYGDGNNQYAIVRNNPIVRVDPYGTWGSDVHGLKTVDWGRVAGATIRGAAIVASFDLEIDEGFSTKPTSPNSGALGRHMDTGGGSQMRFWEKHRENATKEIEKSILEKNKKKAIGYCMRAAEEFEFGRGLHSLQDTSSHRTYPFGDRT